MPAHLERLSCRSDTPISRNFRCGFQGIAGHHSTRVPAVAMRTRLAPPVLYANGNFGKSCLSTLVEVYALFYLTDILGIAPGMAGALLLASYVWDSLSDPLWGLVSDRIKRR